jgi:hypothetical protein
LDSNSLPPADFADVLKAGDHRKSLEAMRDLLAEAIAVAAETNINMVPQIAGRLQAVLTEIATLPPPEEVSASDEIKRRREARLAGSGFAAPASGVGS